MALGAIAAVKAKGIDPKKIPTAGIDGVTDAILAVKRGEMVSILQDARAQAQGALDILLAKIIGPSYQPRSAIWKQYATGMPWNGGREKVYSVPWTPITLENADELLAARQK
jgi:putative xylitol transport system substrate-binding protein